MMRVILLFFISIVMAAVSDARAQAGRSGTKPAPKKPSPKPASKPTAKSPQKPAAKTAAKPQSKQARATSSAAEQGSMARRVGSWTRTIRVADRPDGPTLGESVALAVDAQLVVVPWSFVSEAWIARPGARFYIIDASGRISAEAAIAEIDVAANLALLRSGAPLIPSMQRSQIRMDAPLRDEALFILSSRDWIRPGARYLSGKSDGPYLRYQIGYSANDTSRSRFLFDRDGKLVAISGGSTEQERSWAGASKSLFELLRKIDGHRPASISGEEQRRRQLFYWQERWAQSLVPAKASLSLQAFDCQAYMASIGDTQLAAQVRAVRALECEGKFPLQLGAGYTTGARIWAGEASVKSNDPVIGARLGSAFAAQAFSDLEKAASFVNLMTVPDCSENSIVNQRGHDVRVKFCTTALKVEPGLSDTAVVVSSVDASMRAYYAIARLKGFDQMNTKKVIESLVENVRGGK